jgi:hypothetical protein
MKSNNKYLILLDLLKIISYINKLDIMPSVPSDDILF